MKDLNSSKILYSGHIYTRDVINNRPYYVITYSEPEGQADKRIEKTKCISKKVSREFLDEEFVSIVDAIKRTEALFPNLEGIRVEFELAEDYKVTFKEVKPLDDVNNKVRPISDIEFAYTKSYAKCNYLDVNEMLSDRAYWYPAVVLGSNPRPLDYSLYSELITNRIWNDGIKTLGYTSIDENIMTKVGNKPYISMSKTFEGLTPASVSEKLRIKLKKFYEEKLKQDRSAHADIEGRLVFCCYDFATETRLNELRQCDFTEQEIQELKTSLRSMTEGIIGNYKTISDEDKEKVQALTKLRHEIRACSPLAETNVMKLYGYIEQLLTSMKEYGTPFFTRHARCASIANTFCKSLCMEGYFTSKEMEKYILSIPTIQTAFESDFDRYISGEMTREEFDKLYGHLRLGTYDIRTDNYRKLYFNMPVTGKVKCEKKDNTLKRPDIKMLDEALSKLDMKISREDMLRFIEESHVNREYFRYEYVKSLSLMLDIIIQLGETLGIDREDMSYLEIADLLSYHSRESYIQTTVARRDMYYANSYLILPSVIINVGDIDVIDVDMAMPTYITNKIVEAQIVNLDSKDTQDVTGKIVVMTSPDAGYDWIFSKDIAGYISKYGNAICSMAERCRQFVVPAAIGCGQRIFNDIINNEYIRLDCGKGRISKLNG